MVRVHLIVYRIFVNIIGIGLSAILFKHVHIDTFLVLVLSGILLTIFNLFLKPVLFLLTLPLQILSFGIFYLFLNALILKLTSYFINGFYIDGIWVAVGASIIIGLTNVIFDLLAINEEMRYFKWK